LYSSRESFFFKLMFSSMGPVNFTPDCNARRAAEELQKISRYRSGQFPRSLFLTIHP